MNVMKKTMKKFAAMIAAVMTVSAMGGMSTFAANVVSDHYVDGGTTQSATVDLQAKVSNTTTSDSAGGFDPSKDDSDKHIWNVTISAATLTWDLVRNNNTVYKQNVTWNPVDHIYEVTPGDNDTTLSTYTVADDDTAAKPVNVKNDSNFAIRSQTEITNEANNYGASFTATNPEEPIAVGADADTTITIDTSGMAGLDFNSAEYVTVGKATITLNAGGDIQARS
jgi:hypothetical protein